MTSQEKMFERATGCVVVFAAVMFGLALLLITIPAILGWPSAVKLFTALGLM